ncbi:MAG TPA: rhodanese-like domain-containing protein [Pirellulaceae bacterium]|nr:rhodanese-like domain-containing protein [Pirellulaceae bacterium]
MARSLLTLIVLPIFALVAYAVEPLAHTKDSLDTVKENLQAGKAVMVDVREQSEWDEAHLKIAIHLAKSKLEAAADIEALLKNLPKDKVIYTHCKAGGRALACGKLLKEHGYDVRPLKPGIQALLDAGLEKAEK